MLNFELAARGGLRVAVERRDADRLTVTLAGDLDLGTGEQFAAQLAPIERRRPRRASARRAGQGRSRDRPSPRPRRRRPGPGDHPRSSRPRLSTARLL
jgi:hypothetical protein